MSQEIRDSLAVMFPGFIGGMGKWFIDISTGTFTVRFSEALVTAVFVTVASWIVKETLGWLKGCYNRRRHRRQHRQVKPKI